MAVEVESASQVLEFLGVLRRRLLWIVVPLAISATLGSSFAIIVPKKYVTSTKILVREPTEGLAGAAPHSQRDALVAPHEITALERIKRVLAALKWPEYLELSQVDQLAFENKVKANLKVSQPAMQRGAEATVVNITFAHTDPERSYEFLGAISKLWMEEVERRGRTAEREILSQLRGQRDTSTNRVYEIITEIQGIRIAHDLPPPDARIAVIPSVVPLQQAVDSAESQIGPLARDIEQLEKVLEQTRQEWSTEPPTIKQSLKESDSVDNSVEINGLRQEIAKLRQAQQGLKQTHSTHRNSEKHIEELSNTIKILEDAEVAGSSREQEVVNEKLGQLQRKIDNQELELADGRAELAALKDGLEENRAKITAVQDAYARIHGLEAERALVDLRLDQLVPQITAKEALLMKLEGPAGNPFGILEEPEMPDVPTEPDPLVIVLFSIVLGLGIGLGAAVLLEYSRSCFRSVRDISRVMVVPVLGTINAIETRRQGRRAVLARAIVGTTTFVLVGCVSYVTWAWKEQPERLSHDLRNTIEGLREQFE